MIGALFLFFVFAVSGYAAYEDMRTMEVADSRSLLIGLAGILYALYATLTMTAGVPGVTMAVAGTIALILAWAALFRVLPGITADQRIGPVPVSFVSSVLLFAVSAAIYGLSILMNGVTPVVQAAAVGTGLFILGWTMYLTGMWGGADALMLGAFGYAIPVLPSSAAFDALFPFPVTLVMTVMIVGAIYSTGYAGVLVARDRDAIRTVVTDLHARWHHFAAMIGVYAATSVAVANAVPGNVLQNLPPVAARIGWFFLPLIGLYALTRCLHVVEHRMMRTTVDTDVLQAGDVLAEQIELQTEGYLEPGPVEGVLLRLLSPLNRLFGGTRQTKIVGLTPEQVVELQDRFDTVDVKTGVPFIAAFPIALVVLATVGDPMHAFIALLTGYL